MIKIKRKKDKGFTLIELLATIVILAIVSGLVVYVAINTINNSKENSYKVTINSIEDKANDYLMENNDRLFYVTDTDNSGMEYQCVTVGTLVDFGYFSSDVLESKVSENRNVQLDDYIYISRNMDTKTVEKTEYLLDENISLCSDAINAEGDVIITVTPNDYSSYKDVTIKYTLKNYYNSDDYSFKYSYDRNEYSCNNDNCNVEEVFSVLNGEGDVKTLRVYDNGKITGYIEENGIRIEKDNYVNITNIDITSPVIEMNDLVKVYGVSFDLMEGVMITDNVDTDVSTNVYLDGKEITSYESLQLGENIVTYKAIDKFGNESSESRKIIIVLPDKEFNYLEQDQVYEVMADGTYIIEAYGAQGGNSGGLGGYVKAEVPLKVGDKLIVNTGGVNGYNGGGGYKNSSYYPGGGASTVRYNGSYIVIAGGGGAKGNDGSGGAGGSGDGSGAASVGSGAGISGSNGGGGSSSNNYSYSCNCQTCGGGCSNWVGYYTCCWECGIGSYECCKIYDDHPDYPHCSLMGTCYYTKNCCGTCGGYCASYAPTYTCNCQTCTKKGKSGDGGSNKIVSPAMLVENISGSRSGNGYVKVSYKL